jgi:nitrate reductase assembly molybdenum cofactor insertion protein NarJ
LAKEVLILKESVAREEVSMSDLTTDCHFVTRTDGGLDIVRGQSMVKIFDYYHDKGVTISRIEVSGGRLNPKLSEPRV